MLLTLCRIVFVLTIFCINWNLHYYGRKKVIHIAHKNSDVLYGTSDTLCSFSLVVLYLTQFMLTTFLFSFKFLSSSVTFFFFFLRKSEFWSHDRGKGEAMSGKHEYQGGRKISVWNSANLECWGWCKKPCSCCFLTLIS